MTIFNLARSRNTDIPDKFQRAVSSSTCDVTLTGDSVTLNSRHACTLDGKATHKCRYVRMGATINDAPIALVC